MKKSSLKQQLQLEVWYSENSEKLRVTFNERAKFKDETKPKVSCFKIKHLEV